MKYLLVTIAVVVVAFLLSCHQYGTREMIDWLKRFNDKPKKEDE